MTRKMAFSKAKKSFFPPKKLHKSTKKLAQNRSSLKMFVQNYHHPVLRAKTHKYLKKLATNDCIYSGNPPQKAMSPDASR